MIGFASTESSRTTLKPFMFDRLPSRRERSNREENRERHTTARACAAGDADRDVKIGSRGIAQGGHMLSMGCGDGRSAGRGSRRKAQEAPAAGAGAGLGPGGLPVRALAAAPAAAALGAVRAAVSAEHYQRLHSLQAWRAVVKFTLFRSQPVQVAIGPAPAETRSAGGGLAASRAAGGGDTGAGRRPAAVAAGCEPRVCGEGLPAAAARPPPFVSCVHIVALPRDPWLCRS